MTDVLEPLRQAVFDAEPNEEVSACVSLQEAHAILDAYTWRRLADLGDPQPGVWPWDGTWVLVRISPKPRADSGFELAQFVGRNWRYPGGYVDGTAPTHVRPIDPPPGGGDGQ